MKMVVHFMKILYVINLYYKIIAYFKAHLDEEYGIKGNKTLDH